MSTTTLPALSLREAREMAQPLIKALLPHCERVEVAGSIRRGKPFVNDIEIVCIPKTVVLYERKLVLEADFFCDAEVVTEQRLLRVPGFVDLVNGWQGASVDECHQDQPFGDAWNGRYVKFMLADGRQVDLFITTPERWGYTYFIRTGSTDFVTAVKTVLKRKGFVGVKGELVNWSMRKLNTSDEAIVFALAGMSVPPPHERELTVDGLSKWMI